MREEPKNLVVTTEQLAASLQQLVGKRCWGFAAGEGTGSVISLYLGDRTRRREPVSNPSLSPEVREHDPEYSMFIECVWRLDSRDRIVCGAWDSNKNDGPMLAGLGEIVNHAVRVLTIDPPAMDLTMVFDNDLSLRAFCDQINVDDAVDNYSFFTPSAVFTVGTRSLIRVDPRNARISGGG